jgi:hypothetical protein
MKSIFRIALPLALLLGGSAPLHAQFRIGPSSRQANHSRISASYQSNHFGISYSNGRVRVGDGCHPRIRTPRHRHHSSCYQLRRQRTWVAGHRRLVTTPARYGWIRTSCGTHWGLIAAASNNWVQDPGRYIYQNKRHQVCGH